MTVSFPDHFPRELYKTIFFNTCQEDQLVSAEMARGARVCKAWHALLCQPNTNRLSLEFNARQLGYVGGEVKNIGPAVREELRRTEEWPLLNRMWPQLAPASQQQLFIEAYSYRNLEMAQAISDCDTREITPHFCLRGLKKWEATREPMVWAVKGGNLGWVEVVLKLENLDPKSVHDSGEETGLTFAVGHAYDPPMLQIACCLLADERYGDEIDELELLKSLFVQALNGDGTPENFRLMVAHRKFNPNLLIWDDCYPFAYACYKEKWDTALLIAQHPKLDPNQSGSCRNAPLHHLVPIWVPPDSLDYWATVDCLLANPDLDPNQKNHRGATPLHEVSSSNEDCAVDFAKRLLAHPKIRLDIKNIDGKTPYDTADWRIGRLFSGSEIPPDTQTNSSLTHHDAAPRWTSTRRLQAIGFCIGLIAAAYLLIKLRKRMLLPAASPTLRA